MDFELSIITYRSKGMSLAVVEVAAQLAPPADMPDVPPTGMVTLPPVALLVDPPEEDEVDPPVDEPLPVLFPPVSLLRVVAVGEQPPTPVASAASTPKPTTQPAARKSLIRLPFR